MLLLTAGGSIPLLAAQTKEFKARMDHLNHFLTDMRVPIELKTKTRDHFRFTRDLVRKQSYADLYERFSPRLRGEVLCHISLKTLQSVPYFQGCERELLNLLSQRLSHHGYAQGEIIYHNDQGQTLSIVTRGTAVRGGKPITLYQYWGEDMIVTSVSLRDKRPAAALTYVEIVCLRREALMEELKHYPMSAHHIHVAAVSIAMMRAPVLIANYLQDKKKSTTDLFGALKRLGTGNNNDDDSELQAMLKAINGGRPLRGFARELVQTGDADLAKRSADALEALGADDPAGPDGALKMLVDEDGNVVTEAGESLNIENSAADPVLTAINAVKQELKAELANDRAHVRRELGEIKTALATLLPAAKVSILTNDGAVPSALGVAQSRPAVRRRKRHGAAPPASPATCEGVSPNLAAGLSA